MSYMLALYIELDILLGFFMVYLHWDTWCKIRLFITNPKWGYY